MEALNEPLLKVKNLSAGFYNEEVLKNINLSAEAGQVLAVIGPSGCGKSTFLRCLNRMHEEVSGAYTKGAVFLEGRDIYAQNIDPVRVRRLAGMVFQKPNPFPGLSIFENVAVGLKLAGFKKSEIKDKVEISLKQAALWTEVKDILNRPGTALSGGQQQRLCLARALVLQPKIILMDEPTSALDPVAASRIESLIQEIKKQVTIVIVTHNMQQAARISNKCAFLLMGELIECGKTSTIFTNPQHKKTEAYITGRFG